MGARFETSFRGKNENFFPAFLYTDEFASDQTDKIITPVVAKKTYLSCNSQPAKTTLLPASLRERPPQLCVGGENGAVLGVRGEC